MWEGEVTSSYATTPKLHASSAGLTVWRDAWYDSSEDAAWLACMSAVIASGGAQGRVNPTGTTAPTFAASPQSIRRHTCSQLRKLLQTVRYAWVLSTT